MTEEEKIHARKSEMIEKQCKICSEKGRKFVLFAEDCVRFFKLYDSAHCSGFIQERLWIERGTNLDVFLFRY